MLATTALIGFGRSGSLANGKGHIHSKATWVFDYPTGRAVLCSHSNEPTTLLHLGRQQEHQPLRLVDKHGVARDEVAGIRVGDGGKGYTYLGRVARQLQLVTLHVEHATGSYRGTGSAVGLELATGSSVDNRAYECRLVNISTWQDSRALRRSLPMLMLA